MRLFLYSSGDPGKLSITGFAGSLPLWNQCRQVFSAEYLYGCNMSFQRKFLLALPDCDWLTGYSLGGDLVLPWVAAQQGPVVVDPQLGIRHYQSPLSRDKLDMTARMQIVNHAHLLKTFGAGLIRKLLFFCTWLGLFLVTLPQGDDGAIRRSGYLAAVKPAWRILEE